MDKSLKIAITGAESTGKSTLSKQLAEKYETIWVPEYSRDFIEKLNRKYTYDDIETIAKQQIEIEKKLPSEKIIFFDTWLIITKVWFDFVYGKHPEWLHTTIQQSNINLFLVCDIDMPWEKDPVRENGGENRIKLHQIYLSELKQYNFEFEIISGTGNERLNNAMKAINKYIAMHF